MSHQGEPWPDSTYQHTYGGGARRQCRKCRGLIVWVSPRYDDVGMIARAGYWRHL